MVATAPLATAAATTPIVRAAHNAALARTIVVDARGRSLYRLSGETTRHLKCTASCLGFWPPLTVRSRHVRLVAGRGVHGRLGILRRAGGMLQVTLSGRPLYRFSGDRSKGAANGQGIMSFGGTWSTLPAGSAPSMAPAPQPAPSPYSY